MVHNWKKPNPSASNVLIDLNEKNYISFNTMSSINMSMPLFGSDSGSAETALVWNKKFYILNGDYREEYEKAMEKYGLDTEALYYAVFLKNRDESGSSWTTPTEEEKGIENLVNWLEQRAKNYAESNN